MEALSVDRKIILKWIVEKCDMGHLAEDRERWLAFVNVVTNIRVL